jgi:hypothetical protein
MRAQPPNDCGGVDPVARHDRTEPDIDRHQAPVPVQTLEWQSGPHRAGAGVGEKVPEVIRMSVANLSRQELRQRIPDEVDPAIPKHQFGREVGVPDEAAVVDQDHSGVVQDVEETPGKFGVLVEHPALVQLPQTADRIDQ